MNTIAIEDVHDIDVDTTRTETKIDFMNFQGAVTEIELSRKDAELLLERLHEALRKV
jgi:hypothetical protein